MNCVRLIFLFFFVTIQFSYGQDQATTNSYEDHFQLAKQYSEASLFAESIEELNAAIRIAKKRKWKRKAIEASIFLAEIKRKTKDFNEGISILTDLENTLDYPSLHVDKLGRIAALYHESNLPDEQKFDSVELYLERALNLAEKFNLKREKAGLYNEMGYRIGHKYLDSCLYLLGESSRLFMEVKDTQNYIVARTNMLRTYETIGDSANTMLTFNELNDLVAGKNWHTLERELYVTISRYYEKKGDKTEAYFWLLKCKESHIQNIEKISSKKLNSFRALYENKKIQNRLEKKEEQLKKEATRTNELILYISLLLIMSLGITLLLLRERKLKRIVGKANDDYQILLVESNHRIKNNLQMVISMLKFASKDLSIENSIAFEKMSGKVKTISALHKELYSDIHNERVDLKAYFFVIMELNDEITSNQFELVANIDTVLIKSERIVYFGLIFNEMLANSIEHQNSPDNKLVITIHRVGNHFHFSYHDNSSFVEGDHAGTGIGLIKQLVKRIKGTNFKLDRQTGRYEFDFHE
ncbi:MAG: two-component sensor histidine kinase [Crocinitomicaceae bacterium]|jgi:two-component sensor histidine kinase